jgi:phosphoribosylanthranilate isomerase
MKPAAQPTFVIKICGITNAEDARVAVDAGANALGFNFYPKSPRYITPELARQIIVAVPGDYLKVGVFVNSGADEVSRFAAAVPLDVVQLHGNVSSSRFTCRAWRAGTAISLKVSAEREFDAYLLDGVAESYGGSGNTFDWSLAAKFPYRAVIAGGLDHSNVREAIRVALPWGVDACSKLESSPGKKDGELVREFVRAAIQARNHYIQEMTL